MLFRKPSDSRDVTESHQNQITEIDHQPILLFILPFYLTDVCTVVQCCRNILLSFSLFLSFFF